MEQLAQKRLHLLLRKCFASRWPLTRVLSNLWSTQCRGGLIILNYISKRQRRWEEQPIYHRGSRAEAKARRLGRRRKQTGKAASVILESGAASLKEPWCKETQSRPGACVCARTRVCSQGVTADTVCCPWLFSSTTFNEPGDTLSFVCRRECCYLIIFN